MAIVLKSKEYGEIVIDSEMVIGVLGEKYSLFLKSLDGDSVYYLNKKIVPSKTDYNRTDLLEYRKLLKVDTYYDKDIKLLSHSEKKLLQYYLMIASNSKIIIIDEPYLDLDNSEIMIVKRIISKLIKEGKTIIVGSRDINVIYSLCKKVMIINNRKIIYDDVKCLNSIEVLNRYNLDIPKIVEFVVLAKEKGIRLPYSKDIRDLMKDVYRNVSKK